MGCLSGRFAPYFWGMLGRCFGVPGAVLRLKRTRNVTGTVGASVSVWGVKEEAPAGDMR
ncbi:MAG: hypothetical protein ACE5JI_04880 [Acidobacteriota bacterium]